MLLFKKIDLWIQSILFVTTLTLMFLNWGEVKYVFYCYFFVGGWQLLSFIIHGLNKNRNNWIVCHDRILYGKNLIWLVVISAICLLLFFTPVIFIYFFGLLLVTPVYAIHYYWITWKEFNMIKQKNLIHLK